MAGRMVSPNALLEAAKAEMLAGKEPTNKIDWSLVMNYVAANISDGLEVPICKIFVLMYDIPLTQDEVIQIAEFQARAKEKV